MSIVRGTPLLEPAARGAAWRGLAGAGWYYNFEKLPWEDPAEHLRRSPLMYVGT